MPSSISRSLMGAFSSAMILSILQEKDTYGYRISQMIYKVSGGKINWKEGSLYPVLTRLEQDGLISSVWNSEGHRPRRYYSIQEKGNKSLSENLEQIQLVISMFNKLNEDK